MPAEQRYTNVDFQRLYQVESPTDRSQMIRRQCVNHCTSNFSRKIQESSFRSSQPLEQYRLNNSPNIGSEELN